MSRKYLIHLLMNTPSKDIYALPNGMPHLLGVKSVRGVMVREHKAILAEVARVAGASAAEAYVIPQRLTRLEPLSEGTVEAHNLQEAMGLAKRLLNHEKLNSRELAKIDQLVMIDKELILPLKDFATQGNFNLQARRREMWDMVNALGPRRWNRW